MVLSKKEMDHSILRAVRRLISALSINVRSS